MPRMSPAALLRFYKTKVAISRAAGVDKQVVQGWFKSGAVPVNHQITLEVATDGQLKADVGKDFREVVARGETAA